MKAGFYNTGIDGQPDGYEINEVRQQRYMLVFYKTIYEFILNRKQPLMYVSDNGTMYQPDAHFETDQGSIPRCLQFFVQKDRFLGFYFHDSGYRFKGLWVSYDSGKTWRFVELLRAEVDALLREMIKNDPYSGNIITRCAIWVGVRIGGWYGWGRGDERKPVLKNDIDNTKPPIAFA